MKSSRSNTRSDGNDDSGDDGNDDDEEEPPLFAPESRAEAFWASAAESVSLERPLTEEERERLMEKLPASIAKFLIRRADEAVVMSKDGEDDSDDVFSKRRERLIARARAWLGNSPMDEPDEELYKDFMYETVDRDQTPLWAQREVAKNGPPGGDDLVESDGADENSQENSSVGRSASQNFDSDDQMNISGNAAAIATKMVSMFRGSPSDPKEQAQLLIYAISGLIVLVICLKIALAFVQFFVSFTFSFLAIFALSAGIFVFFYVLRF